MPRKSREKRNPAYVELAKRLLEYDCVGMGREPSNLQIAEFIYNRYKRPDFAGTTYRSKKKDRDSIAYSHAERIYKYILKPKDFLFSEEMLDFLVKEITVIGKFDSWADFCKKFEHNDCVRKAALRMEHRPFKELTPEDEQYLRSQVNLVLYPLHFFRYRTGGIGGDNILYHKNKTIIRIANSEEIKEIELLARRVYPCPINGFDIKYKWYQRNSNIFYIYKDNQDLWGNINLLPVTDDCFAYLKKGKMYEHEITASDIYNASEKEKVKYIYVEGLACSLKTVLPLFGLYFESMVENLSAYPKSEIIICAIGGSLEGDALMKKCGFSITGTAIDPRNHNIDGKNYDYSSEYPFFEIQFSRLKMALEKWGLTRAIGSNDQYGPGKLGKNE